MSITTEEKIEVLNETIQYFEDAFEPQDCGWMNTTICGLKHMIAVLQHREGGNPDKHWAEYRS